MNRTWDEAVHLLRARTTVSVDREVAELYPKAYTSVLEAQRGLEDYFRFYNGLRPHEALSYRTTVEVFHGEQGVSEE